MKDNLLKIVKHYGINKQLKYLQSEIFELNEAIINHELKNSVSYEIPLTEIIGTQEHIIEEIADVYVMIEQIRHFYDIPDKDVIDVMKKKIDRQLFRINLEKEREKCEERDKENNITISNCNTTYDIINDGTRIYIGKER